MPTVQLLGDAVFFRSPAVRDLALLLPIAMSQVERRDGIRHPQRWTQILDAVTAAMSAWPVTEVRVEAERSQWCTTAEAATALGVTKRHVRRIAKQLGGELGRRAWLIPRSSLEQRRTT